MPEGQISLTQCEREVLALLAEGKRNSEIAKTLGITENTVETHLKNMTPLQKGRLEALKRHIYGSTKNFNAISGGFFPQKVVFARESLKFCPFELEFRQNAIFPYIWRSSLDETAICVKANFV